MRNINRSYKVFILLVIVLSVSILTYLIRREKQTIKVGFISDLSGRNSQLGTTARNGVLMAIDELNQRGGIKGRKLELLIRDHKGDQKLCFSLATDLGKEGVDVIIGPLASAMAGQVMGATEKKKVLVISPAVSTDLLTGIDDFFVRVIAPASTQGTYLARAVMFNKNANIVIVMDGKNSEYADAVVKGFKKQLKNSTTKIADVIAFSDKTEFPDIIKRIKRAGSDAILFVASGIDTGGIVQQYAKKYSVPQLYGSMWTKLTRVTTYGGNSISGMILVDSYKNKHPTKREQEFNRLFKERFNTNPDFIARNAYESVQIFATAFKRSYGSGSTALKAELLKMKSISGITEDYKLDQYGDVVRQLSLFVVRNDRYELFDIKE